MSKDKQGREKRKPKQVKTPKATSTGSWPTPPAAKPTPPASKPTGE